MKERPWGRGVGEGEALGEVCCVCVCVGGGGEVCVCGGVCAEGTCSEAALAATRRSWSN